MKVQLCIKETPLIRLYYCTCDECQSERNEQNQRAANVHNARMSEIQARLRLYWTDFDSRDKQTARYLFGASQGGKE